jgi:hypothetical protein
MNLRWWVALFVALGATVTLASAEAQGNDAGKVVPDSSLADAVELKNGGYIRGLIVEFDPTSHLNLRLPSGQVQRIAVAEIQSAERAGRPLVLAPAPAAPTPTSAPPAPSGSATAGASPSPPVAVSPAVPEQNDSGLERQLAAIPGPRIRLDAFANQPSYLQRLIGRTGEEAIAYHLVCKVPCRVDLPANDPMRYRISNVGIEPTDWFKLPNRNAKVNARLVSDMWALWPKAMLVGGVTFGLVGGSFLGINALSGDKAWARDTGFVLAGFSGAFFVTSGLIWLLHPRSRLSIEQAP